MDPFWHLRRCLVKDYRPISALVLVPAMPVRVSAGPRRLGQPPVLVARPCASAAAQSGQPRLALSSHRPASGHRKRSSACQSTGPLGGACRSTGPLGVCQSTGPPRRVAG
jgi:hypothetical protein